MSTNNDLQQKVTEELEWDPSVDASHIGVTAKDGIITLTGYVAHYIDKRNAERAARRVADVKAVVDELDLKLPGSFERNDLDIAESALAGLKLNVLVPRDKVQLTVDKGWITLRGEFEWQYQRTAAENTVKFMIGVKGISNYIVVKPIVRAADIKAKIQSALVRNAQLDANQITVDTSGSTATLGGCVRSWAEKKQAENAAWSAPGITDVKNNISISP